MSFFLKLFEKYNLITADFKTVEKKFLDQGEDQSEVKKYLDLFKKLRDKNRLQGDEKNIDSWGKKDFKEFKKRIEELEKEKTGTEKRKGAVEFHKKISGAEKLAENEDWIVFQITTNDASADLAKGTEWCIKHEDSKYWSHYSARNNIYFIISKNRRKDDRWFKIALLVDVNGKKTYWDKLDKDRRTLPSDLNIPKFKTKKAEFVVNIDGEMFHADKIPEGLRVLGDLDLAHAPIKTLPRITVFKSLSLAYSSIESLPERLIVGGHLELQKAPIKSLPKGLSVGGDLRLYENPIKSLPEGLSVGGDLYLRETEVTVLPDDLKVGGDIFVDDPKKFSGPPKLLEKLNDGA